MPFKHLVPDKPKSYGRRPKVPPFLELFRRLQRLPPKFQPAILHSLITRDASIEIARELKKRGHQLSAELVQAGHIARPMFRDKGIGTTEGIGSQKAKGTVHTTITKTVLKKVYGSPELAALVRKYYRNYKRAPANMSERMLLEDIAFGLGSYMVRGEQDAEGNWSYKVTLPRQRLKAEVEQTKKEGREVGHQRREYLANEFRKEVGPMEEFAERNGIDLQKVADKINAKIRAGYYEQLAERLRKKL